MKIKLAKIPITQESLKHAWEGVLLSLKKYDVTSAFQRRLERFEICVCISGDCAKRSQKKIFFVKSAVFD
jgi:hypothetical protein